MSLRRMLTQTATIVRRSSTGTRDGHGNPTQATVEVPDVPCRLEQTEPREVLVGRETYITTHRAAFLGGTELDGSDELLVAGVRFEVIGDPSRADFPGKGEQIVEAVLREVR